MPRRKVDRLAGELFWVDRWTGSSAYLLPWDAKGLYREMLSQSWLRGAKLPADFELIRKIVGCSEADWNRMWPLISHYWRQTGDILVNDTQLKIYTASEDYYAAKSRGGKAGAAKRHGTSASPSASNTRDDIRGNTRDDKRLTSGSVSDLVRTTRSDVRTSGASMAEEKPDPPRSRRCSKDHLHPGACERGICIYPVLHQEFLKKLGGDEKTASARLKAFYADVVNALTADEDIPEDAYTFWRHRFQARFNPKRDPYVGPAAPTAEQTKAALAEEAKRLKGRTPPSPKTVQQLHQLAVGLERGITKVN